jgi:hypothetical protein
MNYSQTQTRPIRGHDRAKARPQIRQRLGHRRNLSASTNSPHPRLGYANEWGIRQSVTANKTRPRLAPVRQKRRTRIVRTQATTHNRPRPQPRSRRTLAASLNGKRFVPAVALSWTYRFRLISQSTSAPFKPKSAFDPATVRNAVEEFTPHVRTDSRICSPQKMSARNSAKSGRHRRSQSSNQLG